MHIESIQKFYFISLHCFMSIAKHTTTPAGTSLLWYKAPALSVRIRGGSGPKKDLGYFLGPVGPKVRHSCVALRRRDLFYKSATFLRGSPPAHHGWMAERSKALV